MSGTAAFPPTTYCIGSSRSSQEDILFAVSTDCCYIGVSGQ